LTTTYLIKQRTTHKVIHRNENKSVTFFAARSKFYRAKLKDLTFKKTYSDQGIYDINHPIARDGSQSVTLPRSSKEFNNCHFESFLIQLCFHKMFHSCGKEVKE